MDDIKTLVEEAKAAARKHAPNAHAIIVAIDTLAEAHQAEVSRLTREAENVRRKWLGHRDTGHLSLVEAADHVVGCLHADIDRLTREKEGLAADLVSIRSAWNTAEAELAAKQDAAPTSASTVSLGRDRHYPSTFDRRWKLADDGFGLERDDVGGNYVHVDDAIDVVHHYAMRLLEMQNAAIYLARNPGACSVTDGEAKK